MTKISNSSSSDLYFEAQNTSKIQNIGVGDGGRGHVPPKFGKKYFSGNYYVKFWHFFGQKSCKIRTFC